MNTAKKIVLLGHFGVGKTSIIRQFVTNEFASDYKVTIGVHILKREVVVNGKNVSLIIWDLEGTKDLSSINKAYLMGSHSFIFAYDITRQATYINLERQIEELQLHYPKTTIKLIGNKVDLIATVDTSLESYTKIINRTDYLTSAKTGENIEQLFNEIATELTA
jgi:small GTP-binding protein